MGGLVNPYVRRPSAPTVALLDRDGRVIDEHGRELELDNLPERTRVWTDYDTARTLLVAGRGEALCWNGEEIRWRHRRFEHGWKLRHSDVCVLKTPFPARPEETLRGLAGWRDWLKRFGAAPPGTTGGAAWSLLRATISEPLWLGVGADRLPINRTIGGRQELGQAAPGRFEGRLELYDLPAAYASTLGVLPYGGRWYEARELGLELELEQWASGGRPVFARAQVRLPDGLELGPLPRRPRKPLAGMAGFLFGAEYPTGGRIQGTWTFQELAACEAVGGRILKVFDVWAHIAPAAPFAAWWNAVQAGRRMHGLAGTLAKSTGNALWGRFCMDARTAGEREIRAPGRRRGTLVNRPFPFTGGLPPSHDLAETVSGRVRARLFLAMNAAGPALVSAHTDGLWLDGGAVTDERELAAALDGWRIKESAHRLEVINPQGLRYWPRRSRWPRYVWAGAPPALAPEAFELAWEREGLG